MKRFIVVSLLLLTACTSAQIPIIESTPLPSIPPRILPTSTTEINLPTALPTVDAPSTNEIIPTADLINQRVSQIDGMPQV
ncbi:MAG TPA: hypothetical protein VJM08_07095, partial [Anaerolineales bacterium]|nr:hypothetical protein [Anaerolineales bacterium]